MGSKTKEVGGGPATGLADNFVDFLSNGLSTGKFGAGKGNAGGSSQTTPGDATARADPVGSTTGVGGVINKFLNGDFGTQKYGVDTSALAGNHGGFDFSKFQLPGAVDTSGFNTDALKNFNPNITTGPNNAPSVTGNAGFQGILQQLMKTGSSNPVGAQRADNNFSLGNVDLSPYTAKQARDTERNVADLRARYGASGGASFGTPAAVAEGNYRAAADAENTSALADIGRKQQELELSRQTNAATINANQYGSWLDAVTKNSATNATALSNALDGLARGIGVDATSFVNMRGQDLDAKIKSGELSLKALSDATGLDLDKLKVDIEQNKSIGQMMNDRAQIESTNQTQNRGLDIEAISKALGLDLGGQELTESARKTNLGAQGDFASQLMQIIAGLSGKGIAQRQVVQQPGFLQNLLSGLAGVAGGASSFLGHGFGGGGGGGPTVTPNQNDNVNGFNEGGKVPGPEEDDTDSLMAMLTPGEFVLNKHATKMIGEDFLTKFNALTHKPNKKPKAGDTGVKAYNRGGQVVDGAPHPQDVLGMLMKLIQQTGQGNGTPQGQPGPIVSPMNRFTPPSIA